VEWEILLTPEVEAFLDDLYESDPASHWRSVVLLVAGDKSGHWDKWYRTAIPRAEQLYDDYLAERNKEMGV
jgi:hypothetical protein